MPQFILQDKEAPAFQQLDDFTQGYIEALFFTENAPGVYADEWDKPETLQAATAGQLDGNIPADVGFNELAPETLKAIMADCEAFQRENAETLQAAYEKGKTFAGGDYEAAHAGHDFWLTRNGHGVGFWDRGLGDIGDTLTDACGFRTAYPEISTYFQDGKVYTE